MLDGDGAAKEACCPMELRQLRYFLQIADLKSFSRAASTVDIAQPALSRQIRKLEEELGTELFYRDGRGALLTDAGKQYYDKVRAVLRQLDQAQTDVLASRDVPTGEVVLGVPPQLGAVLIAQVIRRFRDRFPTARVRVSEGFSIQVAEWLNIGRLDLGFVYEPAAYRNLESVMMFEEALYLVGPPDDKATSEAHIPFRDILPLPLVMPDLPSTLRVRVEDVAARVGASVHFAVEVDSIPAIKQLVIDGAGYTILPHAAVHDEVVRGVLSSSLIVEPEVSRPLGLCAPQKGSLTLATRKLIDLIREEVCELVGEGFWRGRVLARSSPAPGNGRGPK
jgi:LysR family nitrogen assimilation transcriptional regulator